MNFKIRLRSLKLKKSIMLKGKLRNLKIVSCIKLIKGNKFKVCLRRKWRGMLSLKTKTKNLKLVSSDNNILFSYLKLSNFNLIKLSQNSINA